MDQNADARPGRIRWSTPFTSLTPGDIYAAPMPKPKIRSSIRPQSLSILQPPFDQLTSPLIVPGPHVISTSVPGGTGSTTWSSTAPTAR